LAALIATSPLCAGFQRPYESTRPNDRLTARPPTELKYLESRDVVELMIGGARYEMVELPDAMMSTTLFVGNLCEFVTDEQLSEAFQEVSKLKYVPACVARKADMSSLKYGFVTFRSEEEKETALKMLNGQQLNGRILKIEEVKDSERHGRVKAPQKIVDYAVGQVKRQRRGELNTMRRVTSSTRLANDDDKCESYKAERKLRKERLARRKNRGRYKNQQRKNSRAARLIS